MSRIIFFVLIVAVIYFAWRSMRLKQIQLEKRLVKLYTAMGSTIAAASTQ